MLSSIVQGLLEVLLQAVFEVGCYHVGRVVVSLVSLGRWNCEPLSAAVPRRRRWPESLYQRRGTRVVVTVEATQLAGLAGVGLLIGAAVLMWYLTGR
jgi:hypothetical protein